MFFCFTKVCDFLLVIICKYRIISFLWCSSSPVDSTEVTEWSFRTGLDKQLNMLMYWTFTYSSVCLFVCKQALVWDDVLTGPVGLIAEYTLLKVVHI